MDSNTRLPFGKHRGKLLADIPISYLEWVLGNCDNASPALRAEIKRVIDADESAKPTAAIAIPTLVGSWYRKLAAEFHPDHGGSHEGMKAINRANELLLEMAGSR